LSHSKKSFLARPAEGATKAVAAVDDVEGLAPWLSRVEVVRIERSTNVLQNLRRCWRCGGIVEGAGVVVMLVKWYTLWCFENDDSRYSRSVEDPGEEARFLNN
jgi:hypothetical protein